MLLWEDVPEYGRDVLWGELHTYTAFFLQPAKGGGQACNRAIVSKTATDCVAQ